MNNPYEVDVSKEDIATTGASQAEAEFFGVKNTGSNKSASSTRGEESMPAARGRRTGRTREEQKESGRGLENVEPSAANLIIHSPRHLWGLGSMQFHYRVASTDEAFEIIGDMQANFEWMEEEFADRLGDVAALENMISLAQKELLTTLAEEVGEDLPDLTDYSKTEASKLIRELMAARESKPQRARTSRSRSTSRRPTPRPTSGRRRTKASGRTGRQTGGGRRQFDNTKPGGATGPMRTFLINLCRQVADPDNHPIPNDEDFDNMTFDDVSAEITELREALGYEDN